MSDPRMQKVAEEIEHVTEKIKLSRDAQDLRRWEEGRKLRSCRARNQVLAEVGAVFENTIDNKVPFTFKDQAELDFVLRALQHRIAATEWKRDEGEIRAIFTLANRIPNSAFPEESNMSDASTKKALEHLGSVTEQQSICCRTSEQVLTMVEEAFHNANGEKVHFLFRDREELGFVFGKLQKQIAVMEAEDVGHGNVKAIFVVANSVPVDTKKMTENNMTDAPSRLDWTPPPVIRSSDEFFQEFEAAIAKAVRKGHGKAVYALASEQEKKFISMWAQENSVNISFEVSEPPKTFSKVTHVIVRWESEAAERLRHQGYSRRLVPKQGGSISTMVLC